MENKFITFLLLFFSFQLLQANKENRLAIIIPSYCNAQWYQKNLESLLEQDYQNWYAIYVDDCSSDGTADLVRSFITKHQLESKITLIANTERKGALANHWIATHMCDDWDVVVQYDGDDWFSNNKVLSLINELYQDSDVWLTYGSFEICPSGKRGYCKSTPQKTVEERLYRETYWMPGQLRTFYAWVFKKIKIEDLLWDHQDQHRGKFYPASCDLAFSYPMMEMVGTHFKYVDDIVYIHNQQNQINDFKVNRVPQIIASNVLLYKKKYDAVTAPTLTKKNKFNGVDLMIISRTGLDDCNQTIESCQKHLQGVANIFVLDIIQNVIGVYDGKLVVPKRSDFTSAKQLLLKETHNWWKSTEHVFFISNGLVAQELIDLELMADKLESTQAFSFFPSLGIKDPLNAPCVKIDDDLFVWRLCYANDSWVKGPRNLCVFGKKELIRERIAYFNEDLVNNTFLQDLFADGMLLIKDPTVTRVGLSFEEPRIVPA